MVQSLGTLRAVTQAAGDGSTAVATTAFVAASLVAPASQHRLTLASGVPVMSSTVSAAGTVYLTPYTGNVIQAWDGSKWAPTACGELSNILANAAAGGAGPAAAVAGGIYDLFSWNNAGAMTLSRGPAWAGGTSRGTGSGTTELIRVNGVLVNRYAITNGPAAAYGRFEGSVAIDSAGNSNWNEGSSASGGGAAWLGLWNMYNRCMVRPTVVDSTSSHTYSSNAIRPWNNSTFNRLTFLVGLQEEGLSAMFTSGVNQTANCTSWIMLGLDTASSGIVQAVTWSSSSSVTAQPVVKYSGKPSIGLHYLQALQAGDSSYTANYQGSPYMSISADLSM